MTSVSLSHTFTLFTLISHFSHSFPAFGQDLSHLSAKVFFGIAAIISNKFKFTSLLREGFLACVRAWICKSTIATTYFDASKATAYSQCYNSVKKAQRRFSLANIFSFTDDFCVFTYWGSHRDLFYKQGESNLSQDSEKNSWVGVFFETNNLKVSACKLAQNFHC